MRYGPLYTIGPLLIRSWVFDKIYHLCDEKDRDNLFKWQELPEEEQKDFFERIYQLKFKIENPEG